MKNRYKLFKPVVAAILPMMIVSPALADIADQQGSQSVHSDPLDRVGTRAAGQRLSAAGQSNTAFNPAISVILDGAYTTDFGREVGSPEGFEDGHGHDDHDGGGDTGFSLREAEITFSASIDSYLDALVMVAGSEHGFEIEEAYLVTRSLPAGLQIKAGKFLSDIGYLNKQHLHDWDFFDRPLVSEYLFGDHGLQDSGVQFSWVPATQMYTRFGIEILQGTEGIAAYQGNGNHTILSYQEDPDPAEDGPDRLRWQADNGLSDVSGPRLWTTFAKFAPDLGFDHAVQFGLSYGESRAWQDIEAHSSGRLETWDGDAWFWGADVVYKREARGGMGHGGLTLQAEYFYRNIDADYASRDFTDSSTLEPTVDGSVDVFSGTAKQDGVYVQGVYGFAPRWQAGLRAEAIGLKNDTLEPIRAENTFESHDASKRYAGQVTFRPTEFSMFRTQLNYHDYDDSDSKWSMVLQFNISLGVHGAHQF